MSAHVFVLYNAPADPTAFEQYYHGTHIPLVKLLPGLRSYAINKGPIVSGAGASPYYLVADLEFDSMGDIQAAMGSSQGQATAADLPKFASGGVTILMYETQSV